MRQVVSLLVLAVGLSMDATAVAAAQGVAARGARYGQFLKLAVMFGLFQAAMPILGWAVADRFSAAIDAWQHWIAFVLLAGIGAKMLYEARNAPGEEGEAAKEVEVTFRFWRLTVLAVATSIDALAAGVTLPTLGVPVLASACVIGATTTVLSLLGVALGRHFGARIGRKLDALGGVLLIGLGFKVLLEHLV